MHADSLHALEFPAVREALAEGASTPLSRARCLSLEPASAIDDVRRSLALTSEAVRFTKDAGSLSISAPDDLESLLRTLDLGEQALDPLSLLGLARFVGSVSSVAAGIGP